MKIWLKLFLKHHVLWCTFVGFEPHRFALSGSYIFRAQIKKKYTWQFTQAFEQKSCCQEFIYY